MTTTAPRLQLRLSPRWDSLCHDLARELAEVRVDPFDPIPVTVAHPAVRRRLSQQLALHLGLPGEGLCAGIIFEPLGALRRQLETTLLGIERELDPWRIRGLALALVDVMADASGEPWFRLVEHHLAPDHQGHGDRPGRRLVTAHRIARLLRGYTSTAPEMVRAWSRGDDVDPELQGLPAEARWQPELWRRVRALLAGVPDPVTRHDLLLERLQAGQLELGARQRLRLFDPVPCEPLDRALVASLAHHLPTTIWLVDRRASSAPLREQFGRLRDESVQAWQTIAERVEKIEAAAPGPQSLLAALQQGERLNHENADDSVQLHRAHGLDRQVEVAREVVTGLFEDDPTLEPRDVAIVCTDLEAAAPLVRANFCLDAEQLGGSLHPAHGLRVQLSGSSLDEPNHVIAGLRRLFAVVTGRAPADDLLELCANPALAAAFGLGPDDHERIVRLVRQADIRWGLDGAHRTTFGLPDLRQSTWLAGLERMLVGVAMGQQPPAALGTALPLAQVDSSDVTTLGTLAEVISRVRKQAAEMRRPAPVHVWLQRLHETIALLFDAPGDLAWQVAQAHSELADLAEQSIDRHTELDLGDVRALFEHMVRRQGGRPNHGNGSLLVGSLTDLAGLPHRVVILVGLDDHDLAQGGGLAGDDLCHHPGVELDPRARSRQLLADAVLAARERLVVVHQGFSPRTNEQVAPSVLVEQLEGCIAHHGRAQVTAHPLMPHSIGNFIPRPGGGSFDHAAFEGARARTAQTPGESIPRWMLPLGPVVRASEVDLDELTSFFRHPAKELLRHNLGITLANFDERSSTDLPLDPSFLDDWRIGHRMVEMRLAGLDPAEVEAAERLRGEVPPGVVGTRVVRRVTAVVDKVVDATMRHTSEPLTDLDLETQLGQTRLVGRVRVHGNRVVTHAFSKVSGAHLATAWLQVLLLSAGQPPRAGGWRAVHVGRDAVAMLRAPEAELSRTILSEMVDVRAQGLSRLAPLPVKSAATYAGIVPLRPFGERDNLRDAKKAWRSERDEDWSRFVGDWDALLALPRDEADPGLRDASRFVQLTEWFFGPLRDNLHVENLR